MRNKKLLSMLEQIKQTARRCESLCVDPDDVEQEMCLDVLTRDADQNMKHRAISAVRKIRKPFMQPLSQVDEAFFSKTVKRSGFPFEDLLGILEPTHKQVIRLTWSGYTQAEIAEELGLDRSKVGHMKSIGIKVMRDRARLLGAVPQDYM